MGASAACAVSYTVCRPFDTECQSFYKPSRRQQAGRPSRQSPFAGPKKRERAPRASIENLKSSEIFDYMKRIFLSILLAVACSLAATAQSTVKYGSLSYESLLHAMPEYVQVQEQMSQLRKKYEAEAAYNESSFKRQFAEFLQGQKDFPQNILLKRQRDLQDAMEKGMAFRREADALLRNAEAEMMRPVRQVLDAAIRSVGLEHGYEYILNTDANAYPFVHAEVVEDATPYVEQKLGIVR